MIYTTDNTGEKIAKNMTVEKIRSLSDKYPDTNKMIWLVVLDAKTQLEPLKKLSFGDPVLLNPSGEGILINIIVSR